MTLLSDFPILDAVEAELARIEVVFRERGPVVPEPIRRQLQEAVRERLAELNRYKDARGFGLDCVARLELWRELERKITFQYDQELGRRAALEEQLDAIQELPTITGVDDVDSGESR